MLVSGEEAWKCSQHSSSVLSCSVGLRSRFWPGHSSSSTSALENHGTIDLALCTGAFSGWNKFGPIRFRKAHIWVWWSLCTSDVKKARYQRIQNNRQHLVAKGIILIVKITQYSQTNAQVYYLKWNFTVQILLKKSTCDRDMDSHLSRKLTLLIEKNL